MLLFKLDDRGWFLFGFFNRLFLTAAIKFIKIKPFVPSTNRIAIGIYMLFLEDSKVSLQFLFKEALVVGAGHFSIVAVIFVHLIGNFQSRGVFFREYQVRIRYEVIEVIGSPHHIRRHIVIVIIRVLLIHFLAVPSDSSELKRNLLHGMAVFFAGKLIPRRLYIDESAQDTGSCIRDLYRLIRTHK